MLQNDLNNENHFISKIRVRFKVVEGCRQLVLKMDGHAKVIGSATSEPIKAKLDGHWPQKERLRAMVDGDLTCSTIRLEAINSH